MNTLDKLFELLQDGKKVTCDRWSKSCYLYLSARTMYATWFDEPVPACHLMVWKDYDWKAVQEDLTFQDALKLEKPIRRRSWSSHEYFSTKPNTYQRKLAYDDVVATDWEAV